MIPHIYNSLRGYPGRWVWSLEEGFNLMVTELLGHTDHVFGNVYVTSAFGSVDLKISVSKCAGAKHFSPCHLPLW